MTAPLVEGELFQLGYVTRDLARGMALFRERQGVPGFLEFDTSGRGPDLPVIKVALGYSAGIMVELIEPDPRDPGIYRDALREDGGVNLHHLGYLVGQDGFDRLEAAYAGAGVPVPSLLRGDGMCLLYADTRAQTGLFTEMVVPTEQTRAMFAKIPR